MPGGGQRTFRKFSYDQDSPRIKSQQDGHSTWWDDEAEKEEEVITTAPSLTPPPLPQQPTFLKQKLKDTTKKDAFIKFKFKVRKSDIETAAIAFAAGIAVVLISVLVLSKHEKPVPLSLFSDAAGGISIDGIRYLPISSFAALGQI